MRLLKPFVIDTPEQTLARKQLFAEKLLQNPGDPFSIALRLFSDTGEALRVANEWPADLEVIEYQQYLLETHGKSAFLPDQDDTARLAHDMATGKVVTSQERIAALKLYSDIRGWTGKQIVNNNNTAVQVNRVMVVKEAASDADWEEKARHQQARLRAEVIEHVRD